MHLFFLGLALIVPILLTGYLAERRRTPQWGTHPDCSKRP